MTPAAATGFKKHRGRAWQPVRRGLPTTSWFGAPELALTVVVLAWATNFSVVKFATGLWDAYLFNLMRLGSALLVLLPLWARSPRRARFDRRDAPRLLVLALSGQVVFQLGFIHGTDASSAASSALILSLTPVAIAVIAWTTRAEPFCVHTATGLLLALAGAALLAGAEADLTAQLGDLGLLAAAIGWAYYTVGAAPLVRKYGALRITTWTLGIGAALLALPAFLVLDPARLAPPPLALAAAFFSGLIAVALAQVLWGFAAARAGPTLTGVYSNATPLPALALSWLWLGEALPPVKILGGALILGGVMAVWRHRRSLHGRVDAAPPETRRLGALGSRRRVGVARAATEPVAAKRTENATENASWRLNSD